MARITEDYCSKEIYRLLIEKGFDGEVHTTFDEEGYTQPSITLQMAMKWLREVYGLHVWLEYSRFDFNKEHPYLWNIAETKIDGDYWGGSYHKHPEKAVEEAIKYCLENLIK